MAYLVKCPSCFSGEIRSTRDGHSYCRRCGYSSTTDVFRVPLSLGAAERMRRSGHKVVLTEEEMLARKELEEAEAKGGEKDDADRG